MTPPRKKTFPIDRVMDILAEETKRWKLPVVTAYSRHKRDPFKVLISTLLSLRTKDACTEEATARLWRRARSPRGMLKLDEATIAELIYPVGFYKTKANAILAICEDIMSRFDGQVPDEMDDLLSLKGVGRKTANLTLTMGFNKPGICVDIHVHRITNRWGYVESKTPDETETILREILPKKYWIPINDWLVSYGQNLCTPTSPHCSKCQLADLCPRIGVERSR